MGIFVAAAICGFLAGALAVAAWLLPGKARAEARASAMTQQQAALAEVQQQAKLQFEHLAGKIFEQQGEKFSKQSQERLSEVLLPLKERFGEFQKKLEESFGTQAKEQHSLKDEIRRIVETNEKMRLQTDNLTNALKGNVKAQGNWGEVMLERILEDAGLQKGRDYVLQGEGVGMKHVEHGGALRPDVIVNLPEGKHIIIDSKVSLTHYERYCAETDEAARLGLLKQYLASIRAHINGLESRGYQHTEKLSTPDMVLMFMPIEGAFSLAVQQDAGLHAYAWNKKVALVCPTTLFATLRTIASLWKIETQNRNAQEIARRGGELYDKIAGFIGDMQEIEKHLGRAVASYDEARRKLSEGKGNMLRQAEMLKDLGAKTTKQLPKELLGEAETAPMLAEVS